MKIYKIDKPLSRLIKKKRERTQINTIRIERGEIINRYHRNIKDCKNYYKELYVKTFENLDEMHKFLEKI